MAPFRDRDIRQRCRYGDVEFIAGRGIFSFTPFNIEEAGFERMDINLAGCSPESSRWLHIPVFFYFDGHWTKLGTIAEFFEFIERHNNVQMPVRSEGFFNPDTNEHHIDATMHIRTIHVHLLEEPFYHLRRIANYLFQESPYITSQQRTNPWVTPGRIEVGHTDTFQHFTLESRIYKNRGTNPEVEKKAELLLEKVIGSSKFKSWKKTGKFTYEGKFGVYEFSGTEVVLERTDKIGKGLEKKLWYKLCIQPKEQLPIADVLASKVLLLKSDEEQFCKTSNFRSVSTKDEYTLVNI